MAVAEIKDRRTVADHVADWMHANCPSWSIDTLLTWPDRATAMGRWVCRRLGRRATPQNIHQVCRAALSSRKRGDLGRDRV
jgi:hypothetical protein